jgi:subtilisin
VGRPNQKSVTPPMNHCRRRGHGALLGLALAALLAPGGLRPAVGQAPLAVPGSYIVRFQPAMPASAMALPLARQFGVRSGLMLERTVNGIAADLNAEQVWALRHDPRVRDVVPDGIVSLEPAPVQLARGASALETSIGIAGSSQRVPTGVSRCGATRSRTAHIDGRNTALNVDVAVIDTGIDRRHPDLNVVGGFSPLSGGYGVDPNGHGTHVAGTIAARDNGSGVVGVAPGARLWSIRVLPASGVGKWSNVIAGLEYVTAHADVIDVANISFGSVLSDDGPLHDAVDACVQAGVTVVCSAGNGRVQASIFAPGRYDSVICVSALADSNGKAGPSAGKIPVVKGYTDLDETFADFSNYGPNVDLIAPGVKILSTWPGGGTAVLSGTSQAAPHVSGAAALYRVTHPTATPAEVKAALIAAGAPFTPADDPDGIHEPALDVSSF